MTGKQLKNSILQLAIQGKLVPQDPHDEPASELLKRIRKEKEQLVKTGKLKKKDLESTPIAEDEKPFEIPETWEWCRICEISSSYIGLTYSPSDVSDIGTIVLRSSNIKNGKLDLSDKVRVIKEIPEKLIVRNNDILICARNGSKKLVGKSAIIEGLTENMTFGAFMAICKTSFYKFVYQFLQSDYFFSQLREVSGTTTINQLTQNNFNKFIIPLPPLSEQQRIVSKIEELMPLVEEYDKAQSELDKLNESLPEQLKKSILQQAIMGKLVPQDPNDEPASELLKRIHKEKENLVKSGALKKKDLITTPISDDEKPFDIPESWEWVRLGEISSFNGGFAFKSINYVEKGLGTRVLRISDFSEHGIIEKSPVYYPSDVSLIKYVLTEGDIVMCMTGGTVGKSFHVKQLTEPFYVNQRVADIKVHKAIDSDFIYLVIISSYIQSIITDSKNSTNDNISSELINGFMIPLPPLSEQHRIVSKIEELFSILK